MGTSPVSNKKMMVKEEKQEFPEVSENDIIWHMVTEMLYPTVPEMTTHIFAHF